MTGQGTATTIINVRGIEEPLWLEFGAWATRLKRTRSELLNDVLREWLQRREAELRGQSVQEIAYAAGLAVGRGTK